MDAKEKLYALLNDFYNSRMGIELFCRMFSDTFRLEIEYDCLSEIEYKLFGELSRIAYGYTDNTEDLANCPQYYFSDKQVVAKFEDVVKKLQLFL